MSRSSINTVANILFAAQVERELDVNFRAGRDSIMVKCMCDRQYVPAVDY